MGFTKKTWKNRIAEYINRRLLTNEDGSTNLVTVARDEGTISQEGDAFNAANMNDLEDRIAAEFDEINQSLTNLNDSKKTYLRLVLPNLAADAKTVCDYINKNYLLGQLSPATTVDFDVVASNADWFTGTLSTDSTTLFSGRTVWGIVQQRSMSADNSTVYKYFAAGEGGAGSVSPFKRYQDGYNDGYNAGYNAGGGGIKYKSGVYDTGLNGETWRTTSFNTGLSSIVALQIRAYSGSEYGVSDEGDNRISSVSISGGSVTVTFYAGDYTTNYIKWLAVGK